MIISVYYKTVVSGGLLVNSQQASGFEPSKPLGAHPASLWVHTQQASGNYLVAFL